MGKYLSLTYTKISIVVSIALAILIASIKIAARSDTYFYILGYNMEHISPYIVLVLFIILLSSVWFFVITKCEKKKVAIVITALVSVIVIAGQIFDIQWSKNYPEYYEFVSEDGAHNIIVEEDSYLLYGFGAIYEKTSPFTMKKIGSYDTDDGYRPFTGNEYYFVWNENDFELHYKFDGSSSYYETIKIEYIK